MTQTEEILQALEHLLNDDDVPKSVYSKIDCLISDLKQSEELSLCVNKAITDLEELSNDVNLPAFVRTQIWSILSLLGALEAQIMNTKTTS